MAKQVFEFTDAEVIEILWRQLIKDGKTSGDGSCEMTAQRRGWKLKGFDVTLKIDDEK